MSSAYGNAHPTGDDLLTTYEHHPLSQLHSTLSSMSTPEVAIVPATLNHQDEEQDVENVPDNDSAYGESLADDETRSLASFLTDYPYENGRRYHAYRDGSYWVC